MTISHNIYPEHSLVYVKFDGSSEIAEFGAYALSIASEDSRFVKGMNTLLDARLANLPPPEPNEHDNFQSFVNKVKERTDQSPPRKLATVVADISTFGVSRQRSVYISEVDGLESRIFFDMGDALTWLDLSPDFEASLTTE